MVENPYAETIARVEDAILRTPGELDLATRTAIAAHAARIGGLEEPAGDVPAELLPYVEKVARHAYKVVDRDVDALRDAGYSEDAIFEVTLAAALGAARARLAAGTRALDA